MLVVKVLFGFWRKHPATMPLAACCSASIAAHVSLKRMSHKTNWEEASFNGA